MTPEPADGDAARSAVMRQVEPEDLLNFGLIPEFIGRLPMISVLDELSEEELVCVLTDTKNALTKQYTKLFAMDNVGPDLHQGRAARPGAGSGRARAPAPAPCAPFWKS